MPAYALLLRPAANHLYSKGAAALNQAELSVLNERPEALLDALLKLQDKVAKEPALETLKKVA